MSVVICGNCGQANDERATFCSSCNAFLEWAGQLAHAAPQGAAAPPGDDAAQPPADPTWRPPPDPSGAGAGRAVVAVLSQGVQSVEPGGQIVFTLEVRNVSGIVDELTVEILGDAAAWSEVQPRSLNLMPGTGGVVTIRIRPPRSPQVRSGWVNFGVGVRSRQYPDSSVVERGAIDVAPFTEVALEVVPHVARGSRGATFAIRVRNDGNLPITVAFSAEDPERAIDFESAPPTIQVDPGVVKSVALRARAREGFWFGTNKTRPFQVTAAPSGLPIRTLDATFVQHGFLPMWLPPGIGVLAAVVVLAAAILLSGGGGSEPTPGPSQAAVATPTSALVTPVPVAETPAPETPAPATDPPTPAPTAPPPPEPTAPPTPAPPPLTGDAIRVVTVSPPVGTELRADDPVVFEFVLDYSLESEAEADLYVSIAQMAETSDACGTTEGSLVVAEHAWVGRGVGTVTVIVTWPGGNGAAQGYLAPAPSLWRVGGGSRISYFGVDEAICLHFGS